jgi:hypothetical protein
MAQRQAHSVRFLAKGAGCAFHRLHNFLNRRFGPRVFPKLRFVLFGPGLAPNATSLLGHNDSLL